MAEIYEEELIISKSPEVIEETSGLEIKTINSKLDMILNVLGVKEE